MEEIMKKVNGLFEELGFERTFINEPLFHYGGCYYKVSYVEGLKSLVIESALNFDEAVNRVFEDSDVYSLSLDENEILTQMRKDLIQYYMSE